LKNTFSFTNWGGRFSGRYRARGSVYDNAYAWLADTPDLSEYSNPYAKAPDQWMSVHDQYRLQLYKFNRAVYYGDHYNAFRFAQYLYRSGMLDDDTRLADVFGRGGQDVLFVATNLFQLCSDTFADLISQALGPITPVEDNKTAYEAVKRISDNSNLRRLLHTSAVTGSYKGDIVWTIHGIFNDGKNSKSAKSPQVTIRGRRVDTWFPTVDPQDRSRFSEHMFAYKMDKDDKSYAVIERYLEDAIKLEVKELSGNEFKGDAPPEIFAEVFGPDALSEYPAQGMQVVHVANKIGDDNDPYGDSDYGRGVLSLADELNQRETQLSYELDKHGKLGMSGPYLGGEETENPENDNPTNRGVSGRYIEREGDDPEPKYIDYPTNHLTVTMERMAKLYEEIPRQMRMSPRLLGYKAGAAEEAFDTLRLACVNTLLRNKTRIMLIDEGIIKAVRSAMSLEQELKVDGAVDPDEAEIKVRWGDGFPMDEEKAARIWDMRVGHKPTATRLQAVQAMDGVEGAEDTVEAIRAEENEDMGAVVGLRKERRDLNLDLEGAEPGEGAGGEPEKVPEINAGMEEKGQPTQSR